MVSKTIFLAKFLEILKTGFFLNKQLDPVPRVNSCPGGGFCCFIVVIQFQRLLIFVIRRKSFSVVLKIPYVKIQVFRDRSFTWLLNYFLAKFLEILTTGSLELRRQSVNQRQSVFRATAHAHAHQNWFLGRLCEGSSGSFRSKTNNV